MEILIKGMDMPETCIDCPLHDGEYGQCNINHNIYISFDDRPRKCPLIEINSHYLIDANLPSAQPEPCEDAVSRKAVQYLLAHFVNEDKYNDACDGLKHLPSVTPKQAEPCEDAVSRQAAIDALGGNHGL